jgi:murein DD-endopeptidase MepM/ murein hydrolase activator NlpD
VSLDPVSLGRFLADDTLSKSERTEKAGELFEAYFLQLMVTEMRKSVPDGMFSSPSMSMFTEMFDKTLADNLAESGGIGLAQTLARSAGGESVSSITPTMQDLKGILKSELRNISSKMKGVLPTEGNISSHFGMRLHPILHKRRMHKGLDIAAPENFFIRSVANGTVTVSGERGGHGNVIVIDHGDGWSSTYAHCNNLDVKVGQKIKAGQHIGSVGQTGMTTGPHLHFEVHHHGKAKDPIEVFGWDFDNHH